MLRVYPGVGTPSRNGLELDKLLSRVPGDEDKDIAWSTPKSKGKRRCPTQQKRVRFGDSAKDANQFYL